MEFHSFKDLRDWWEGRAPFIRPAYCRSSPFAEIDAKFRDKWPRLGWLFDREGLAGTIRGGGQDDEDHWA